MIKTTSNLKDNTFNTFYTTNLYSYNESQPFSACKKHFDANSESIDNLSIEAETLLQKLAQKISLDESKIEKNFIGINQIGEQIEQIGKNILKQKDIDSKIKNKKEEIRHLCGQKKHIIQHFNKKGQRELKKYLQIVEQNQRQLQTEKQNREENWSSLIDQFQKQINRIQKQFKELRTKDDQVFEQNSVDLYNFESKIRHRLEQENQTRKKQHEMVVKLVSQSIENIRYSY